MNTKMLVAIALIALGVIAFAYQGINYTTRGHDMNIGSLHMSTEQTHHIPLPPILGGIALVGGIALLMSAKRGSSRAATS
jgi:hypothetical protein